MNQLTPFNFKNHSVRAITDESGEPWFVAADVCSVLEHTNPSMAIQSLDDDERAKHYLGRQGETWVINESGLYSLILTSRKPEAKAFKKWITSEVLPTIRKTGGYTINNQQPPQTLPELQVAEVAARVLNLSETSKIRMFGKICEQNGISAGFLPSYSTEGLTRSLTDLLNQNGSKLSARAANKILIDMGILKVLTRPSSKGTKEFKSLTDYGLKFGKNETSPQNPRETQPLYFVDRFPELLAMIRDWLTHEAA